MKHILFFFSIILSCVFASCKKDIIAPPLPELPTVYPNYSQLKVGNYWIYQRFNFDGEGNAIETQIFDSCYISKDTLIQGTTYYKMNRPGYPFSNDGTYLRDSLHYIVNSSGEIVFSSEDFSTTFKTQFVVTSDTVAKVTRKMADKDVAITTPAGIFVTSDSRTTYEFFPGWDVFVSEVSSHARYAVNVGLVLESGPVLIGSLYSSERRLVRYHVEN